MKIDKKKNVHLNQPKCMKPPPHCVFDRQRGPQKKRSGQLGVKLFSAFPIQCYESYKIFEPFSPTGISTNCYFPQLELFAIFFVSLRN